jgi:hypothetical protein
MASRSDLVPVTEDRFVEKACLSITIKVLGEDCFYLVPNTGPPTWWVDIPNRNNKKSKSKDPYQTSQTITKKSQDPKPKDPKSKETS